MLERLILWPYPRSQQQALKSENLCLSDGHQNQYIVMIYHWNHQVLYIWKDAWTSPETYGIRTPGQRLLWSIPGSLGTLQKGGLNLSHLSNLMWQRWDQQPLPMVSPQQHSSLLGLISWAWSHISSAQQQRPQLSLLGRSH